jgi:exopolyphosphatase/guanosine-5'-triphosphate,3'-diphosphate pyrophosphatase
MAQIEKLAVIDIGSNAIRMVIAQKSARQIQVLKKYRFPIRLGADVFENGKISQKNLKEAIKTFCEFKELTSEYGIKKIKAVGTSALREAKNQKEFVEEIAKNSLIQIQIIDGVEEARLIHLAVKNQVDLSQHRVLLIDIGGGSVELTSSANSLMQGTQSFPFGTVRILERLKKRKLTEAQLAVIVNEFSEPLGHFLKTQQQAEFAVGTGGNLETLGKIKPLLLQKNSRTFLTLDELTELIDKIKRLTPKERVEKWNLRPDRADVILPAAMVVQSILAHAKLEKILIPYVGLKDGLLWSLA